MPNRPKYSRWKRLPGVFRTGDNRPTNSGAELDRIILYIPARILDLAESLAEKAGLPNVQDYCGLLLMQAIEKERIQQKVADIEARQGPLEGLKQIADDANYLAEWQGHSDTKEGDHPTHSANVETGLGTHGDPVTVDLGIARSDGSPAEVAARSLSALETAMALASDQGSRADVAAATHVPIVIRKATEPKMTDSSASEIIARHAGAVDDPGGLLPCLRRGEPVAAARSAELIFALNRLEDELRGATSIERGVAHSLHRLALESQVLLTDAWPGLFDERMIHVIRTVQESVERVLSGQDIRYFSQAQTSGSERSS
jgi:hypothetical protein